ncbi:MAG TPA: hypothetical protein VK866_13065 [Acidimicrobiales bacterium]|nr:hypothetical protein [Acidimicrobiales bacterium]
MPVRPALAALAVAVVGVVSLAGCGGDASGGADEAVLVTTTSTTVAPTTTVAPLAPTTTLPPDTGADPPPIPAAPTGPPAANSAYVIGDSVLLGTTRAIPAALADWVVTYDAEGSRRLAQAVDVLAERRSEIGGAVVVQLGNNYIEGERGDYASQLDEAMAVLADVPRVVWLTVAPVSPTREAINEVIRAAGDRWDNLVVADWGAVIADRPELSWDGLHLTPAGREELAAVVAEALGSPRP